MKNDLKAEKDRGRINLRLEQETFVLIDQARGLRPGVISRNTWITEAIQEKLARELGKIPQIDRGNVHVL